MCHFNISHVYFFRFIRYDNKQDKMCEDEYIDKKIHARLMIKTIKLLRI